MTPQPPKSDWRAQAPELNHKQLKALAKASRPWYAKKRTWLLGFVGLIVAASALSAAGGGSTSGTSTKSNGGVSTLSGNDEHPPQADAELTACGTAEHLGYPRATVRVTNHSTKRSNYMVSVKFVDSTNTIVGTGMALMSDVDPGQAATDTAAAVGAKGQATCQITGVERYASN